MLEEEAASGGRGADPEEEEAACGRGGKLEEGRKR